MKQRIMEEIVQQMLPHLDNAQLQKLQEVLEHSLYNYEICDDGVSSEYGRNALRCCLPGQCHYKLVP